MDNPWISMEYPWMINTSFLWGSSSACSASQTSNKHIFEKYSTAQSKLIYRAQGPIPWPRALIFFKKVFFFEVCEAPQACCNLTKSFYWLSMDIPWISMDYPWIFHGYPWKKLDFLCIFEVFWDTQFLIAVFLIAVVGGVGGKWDCHVRAGLIINKYRGTQGPRAL